MVLQVSSIRSPKGKYFLSILRDKALPEQFYETHLTLMLKSDKESTKIWTNLWKYKNPK